MIELVLPIIKYGLAPLEVGPEFAPQLGGRINERLVVNLLSKFEILN